MALTFTPLPDIGKLCPDFDLLATDGKRYRLADFQNKKVLVVMFICNHCPYVKAVEDRILQLARDLSQESVQFVAICSNDPTEYEEDSFENLKKRAEEKQYPFPYLHDPEQTVAKEFDAVCTPDFYVFDSSRKLVYRGRLDDSWKDVTKVTQQSLKDAIENALSEQPPFEKQFPSMGCSIKWL